MATLVKTPSGTWKAAIRKTGWPTTSKTFRTKRDAEDWARRTEDEMVRGVHIERSNSERMTLDKALLRYLSEVTPTKAIKTRESEAASAKVLIARLGKYSLAALSPDILGEYHDKRLSESSRRGTPISNNTVRLELALLSHLFTVRKVVERKPTTKAPNHAGPVIFQRPTNEPDYPDSQRRWGRQRGV